MIESPVASELLLEMNERRVLEFEQRNVPASRAVIVRRSREFLYRCVNIVYHCDMRNNRDQRA